MGPFWAWTLDCFRLQRFDWKVYLHLKLRHFGKRGYFRLLHLPVSVAASTPAHIPSPAHNP